MRHEQILTLEAMETDGCSAERVSNPESYFLMPPYRQSPALGLISAQSIAHSTEEESASTRSTQPPDLRVQRSAYIAVGSQTGRTTFITQPTIDNDLWAEMLNTALQSTSNGSS